MRRRQPRSKGTEILVPYTTLFRRADGAVPHLPLSADTAFDRRRRELGCRRAQRLRSLDPAGAGPARRAAGEDARGLDRRAAAAGRSEEHTSELPSLMRTSYAVFCLKKKTQQKTPNTHNN